jgi:3-methylfumaryl-CoA hydratase
MAEDFGNWVGRTETVSDVVAVQPAKALAATFDQPFDGLGLGSAIPALWSWISFLPISPMSAVGPDGHPRRGGFLPPIALERRMWAGSRIVVYDDLRLGEEIVRTSRIASINEKHGKAGSMVFVTVEHRTSSPRGLAMEEQQDIVYLAIPQVFTPPPPTFAPRAPDWSQPFPLDPVLLFRFSALTFNGHRIHYDRRYAEEVEHYPGLVVHGPLQALALFEAARARAPERRAARFAFRGLRPLFEHDRATLNGRAEDGGLALYTANADGAISMAATLDWR